MHSAGLRFEAPEAGEIKGETDQQCAVPQPVRVGPGSIQVPYDTQGCTAVSRARAILKSGILQETAFSSWP
jgi:hypothetical protein